jgi:GH24 family phage-related lysozyme (muramidase)
MDNRFLSEGPGRVRRSRARSAMLDPIVGLSRFQSQDWTRTFSVQDRVLVVLIENGGVDLGIPDLAGRILDLVPGGSLLPGGVKQRLVGYLRDKIKGLTDSLLENAELTLNRYTAAKPTLFSDVVVLRDGTASYDELKTHLVDLTRAGKLIDVMVLTHGGRDFIFVAGGVDGDKIRAIKTANGGPLSIRAVYMMNCVGASLNQAWIDAGARASAGTIRNNYLPEPTTYFFWQNWKSGQGFETAVTSAYRKTVNLMNEAVRSFVRGLPVPGSSAIADGISLDGLEFVRDSAPVVQGSRAITISSDALSTANSVASSLATTVLPLRVLRALSEAPAAAVAPHRLSADGLTFIKGWESFRAKLHDDAYGHCAIGYGTRLHTGACDGRPVEEPYHDGITDAEATQLVARRLADVEALVNELVHVTIGQNQFDALVSLVSDIGGAAFERSTLLRQVNAGASATVPVEFRKWTQVRYHGRVEQRPALAKRRAAEAERFAKPDAPSTGRSLSYAGAFSAVDYAIPGTFEVIAQPTPNTCWAAVFTMMYCWRHHASIEIRNALATIGSAFVDRYDHDVSLDSDSARMLYDTAGLVPLQSFEPSIDGWLTLLKKYGPLYVDVGYNAVGAGTHAVIVTGMAGDGSPTGTSITYVDPIGGKTVTVAFHVFLAKFEATSAVQWPYTIVHWPPATSSAASLPVRQSSIYRSPGPAAASDGLAHAQFAAVVAGIEVADAAQIGLAAAAMVQGQVAATQGSFTLTFDKAERLLANEARQQMPGATHAHKTKYQRLILHIPQARAGTANADVIAEWEGDDYGEIGTVVIRRDLANSTEFSKSSATINMTWVRQIPPDGVDPRAWPIAYSYDGTFDPLGNGYFEFHGEFEITAFGGMKFTKHEVYSRSFADWAIAGEPSTHVQRGPDVVGAVPAIPPEQLAYLRAHLP